MSENRAKVASERSSALLRTARGRGALVVLALACLLTWLTWRAWPDVFVDFGRELYLPWRVLEGEVLYADLAAFNGPLSVYWNAGWMWLFGGATGLFVSNLLWLGVLLVCMERLAWRLSHGTPHRALATTASLCVFLLVFAFGQTSGVGNYEFLAPYAHEATHGYVFAFLLLVGLTAPLEGRAIRWSFVGVLLGLCFLTKMELFVAALASTVVGWWTGTEPGTRAGALLRLGVGAVGPLAVALASFSLAMPLGDAFAGITASWRGLASSVGELPFYRGELGAGIDRPLANALLMSAWAAGFVGFAVAAVLLERRIPRPGWRPPVLIGLAVVWVLSLLPLDWGHAGRGLPLCIGVLCAWSLTRRARSENDEVRRELTARAVVCVFALVALAKMCLAAKLWHYGFVLASPAVFVLMLCGLAWLPRAVRERDGGAASGRFALAVFLGLFGVLTWRYAGTSVASYRTRNVDVGSGADRIRADARGGFANAALAAIEEHVAADETLLVLPEGISLNYLARRPTPTRFVNFMPPEFALFGEPAMLVALEASPPDAVLLVHKDTTEYGVRFFGSDYGERLFAWFEERYAEVWRHGGAPLEAGTDFGVALYRAR